MHTVPVTPGDYWEILKRRKWGMLLIAAVVMLLSASVALFLPSVYKSYSTIMIEEQHIPSDFVMTTVNTYAEQRVENIKQRVMSFTQLWEIINQYKLYSKIRENLTPEEVVAKMRSDVKVSTISAEIFDRRTGRPSAVTTSFVVAYEGKNPNAVLRVTDTLTTLFLQQNLEVRQKQITDTSDFLANEAKRIAKDLSHIEEEVAEFKKQNINALPELFQVNMQGLNSTERTIEQLNGELRSLKERESYLNTQLTSISPNINTVEEQNQTENVLRDLKLKLSHLSQSYTDEYPDIVSLKSQIAELEQQLAKGNHGKSTASLGRPYLPNTSDELKRRLDLPDNPAYVTLSSNLASIQSDISSIKKQIQTFKDRAEDYRKRIENTPKVEETYLALVNQREALRNKYIDLTQKHQEARVAQELEKDQKGERFTLIEPARFPEKPFKPNRLAIVMIGCILAAGGSVGFAAFREYIDNSIRSAEELAFFTGARVLATVPKIITTKERLQHQFRIIFGAVLIVLLICIAVVLFHFYVMDLDVLLSKVSRRLDRL